MPININSVQKAKPTFNAFKLCLTKGSSPSYVISTVLKEIIGLQGSIRIHKSVQLC